MKKNKDKPQQESPLMMTLDERVESLLSRRRFLAGATATGAGALVLATAGCGGSSTPATTTTTTTPPTTTTPSTPSEADVLNFALNLEYLEAEFYLRAATGAGLTAADAGPTAGAVTGGSMVAFTTPATQQYANEIANHELAHVRFLRKALGSSAVDRPAIDLTNSFNAAASAAGIGSSFNPFSSETNFLLGAFLFEDVGVTAYHGAAGYLTTKANLAAAAGIYAVEAYHAAIVRTLITEIGGSAVTIANQISALRATAGGGNETAVGATAVVAADSNSIAYERTTDQVLHIVYLSAAAGVVSKGGFYPNGLNGNIKASAS
jgi:hypothetical protein